MYKTVFEYFEYFEHFVVVGRTDGFPLKNVLL